MKPRNQHFKQLLAATLAVSSSLGMITPALAQTAAGQAIKNTATATFKDDTGNSYNSTSNEVVINVAEVAGIAITAGIPSKPSPNGNDTLFVEFTITNTGNDPTQFFIPGTATLSNTTSFEQNGKIQITQVNGNDIAPKDVPDAGGFTGDSTLLGTTGANNGSIPPNPGTGATGTIKVRVPIKVKPGANSGDKLKVSLGNTNPADGQNQARADSDTDIKDVYTKDNPNGVGGETNATAPSNGVREAMATSAEIQVGARLQAFATVLKAVFNYNPGANPNSFADDVLTYRLAMRVENPSPAPTGFVASDLYGTVINVDASTGKSYVLVSDAIPDKMQLGTVSPAPPEWEIVYTTDPLTTTAHKANWLKTRPSGKITRVGFIYDTTTAPLSKGTTTGNTITGFSFTVTPETGFTGGQVANIAQVFGQSQPGAPLPNTPTQIVYDESGDKTSNNGLNGQNPDSTTANGVTPDNGGISDGKADPVKDGTDTGSSGNPTDPNTNKGNDTGEGAGSKTVGGEDTVYTIAGTPFNGPNGKPRAEGTPGNTNNDFTNKSIALPSGKPPGDKLSDAETPAVSFTNTVENTSASAQEISLLPEYINLADLPEGTKVTITNPTTGATATYSLNLNAGGFRFDSGTGGTSDTNPVKITIEAGRTANYTVNIDLPGNVDQLKAFPVVINAFIDVNKDGRSDGEPGNKTIDRLYTNYLSLVKEARVLEADGTTVVQDFTDDSTRLSAAATIGRIIEYRITYRNISSSGGTDNVILPAKELVITEDGTAGNNNWFNLTVDPKYTAATPNGSAIPADPTKTQTTPAINGGVTDIQVYINKPGDIAPGASGTFIFQRKIK